MNIFFDYSERKQLTATATTACQGWSRQSRLARGALGQATRHPGQVHRAFGQSALSRLRPLCPGRKLPVEFDLGGAMKLLVELVLCIFHPVAVVLMWINLATRTDLSTGSKLAWAIFGLIPLVPFLYVLTGGELF
jgi:hypothetical protein